MKFLDYIKDKVIFIFLYSVILIVIILLLFLFNTQGFLRFYIPSLLIILGVILLLYDYFRKKTFYDKIDKLLDNLDKKYLITEVIESPNFLDGKLLSEYLYEINKNYLESINNYKLGSIDFKEYIEMWCHEIKTPISVSKMIYENNKNSVTASINDEVIKIENYIEQVLYYARSEMVEKDYIIKEVKLNDVVNYVIKKNKKQLIQKKIKVTLTDLDICVNSDSKWLEFIINQIISNSIKYAFENPTIKISTQINKNNIILSIRDNGIGIKDSEIEQVFDKGFTGTNGRIEHSSTGLGLYLCKKLCNKLNHSIFIKSRINEYTCVSIVFPINSMIK